jgi:hypothetical protein
MSDVDGLVCAAPAKATRREWTGRRLRRAGAKPRQVTGAARPSAAGRNLSARDHFAPNTSAFTTLIGLPAAYATTCSKMSANCSSYSSRVT